MSAPGRPKRESPASARARPARAHGAATANLLQSGEFRFPTMDHVPRIRAHFADSAQLKLAAADALAPAIARAADLLTTCLLGDGKILACGNGGSAADAQHFAAEMIGRFERERPELPALSLSTDTSILTAVANDYSFEQVFAKQVRALGAAGDALLAISDVRQLGQRRRGDQGGARARDARRRAHGQGRRRDRRAC